ncbi:MAG: redoxin family protein [Deltaproteobacteria bacterium]
MKNLLTVLLFAFINLIHLNAQKHHELKFNISNYENDTLLLAYFYGEKQLVKDTIFALKKGIFEYKSDSILDPGVYIGLLYPSKEYFQFLIDDSEFKFTINVDYKDLQNISSKASKDNKLFFEYLGYISEKNKLAKALNEEKSKITDQKGDTGEVDKKLDDLDKEVNAFQMKLINENPKTLTAMLIKANRDVQLPEFAGTSEEVNLKKFNFYKTHYFDNIDFQNPATLFSPFIHNKIESFMENLTAPIPDSINLTIDYILRKMPVNSEIWKYYVAHFLNKYAKSQYVGMDGVYVHIVKNYYAKGLTPWVEQDKLIKIIDNAVRMENVLIGKTAPDLKLYREDKTPVKISEIIADFTVLVFWKPDCGHCKTTMHSIVEFQDKYRDKGIKVVSVCTKMGNKISECWSMAKELKMENLFLNLGDENNSSNFHSEYNIQTTPAIFVLDKNKKILIKQIPGEKLGEIMDNFLKSDKNE